MVSIRKNEIRRTMKTTARVLIYTGFGLLLASLSFYSSAQTSPANSTPDATATESVPEIAPGILQGYISREDQLDSVEFVPPAPGEASPRQAQDAAWAVNMLKLRGTPRWDLAIRDADLHFPAAADTFSCALGIPISEADTPALYMLLRRTLADLGLASYSAKNAYQRERPFMVNGAPICTPDDEEALRKDGSYPSGHTSIGWGWALILTELSPDQTDLLIARGRSFGESRSVCNVHWASDVVAGRLVGAAAVANLHSNEQFLAAMDAAREDIARARAAGLTPQVDCEAEVTALEMPLQ
jgi:acid phosphatase (class A)